MSVSTSNNSFTGNLQDLIEYPANGISKKVLVKDNNCQVNLMSLTAGKIIPEHTSPRNAIATVIEGKGNLNLEGRDIALTPGVLVFMPANAPHALRADTNLTFTLTLSE